MMLVAPRLRVIHVTTHIGLLDAIARINPGLVERTIERGRDTLVKAGIKTRASASAPSTRMPASGLFGRGEEEEKIAPAIAAARPGVAGGGPGR